MASLVSEENLSVDVLMVESFLHLGLLMSLADSTINKLELHGPEGLNHILASMRMYLFRYFFL